MSTEAIGAGAAADNQPAGAVDAVQDQMNDKKQQQPEPSFLHSPPDSNNAAKSDGSDSELSDLDEEPVLDDATQFATIQEAAEDKKTEEAPHTQDAPAGQEPKPEPEEEEDIGEVLPDHWSGKVAVFKPTMHQFKDFKKFEMDKVNPYGMKSGIIKIIPPEEWKSQQPPLDDMIKTLRVREPIKQDIMGSNGTYRQVNILHGRSYNVPQWRSLCDQSEHQPPARRGERRANATKPKPRPAAPKPADAEESTPKKRGPGRKSKRGKGGRRKTEDERPMTPVSPKPEGSDEAVESVEQELGEEVDPDEPSAPGRMGGRMGAAKGNKTQSVSARRKYQRREGSAAIDEKAFEGFDYRMDLADYTPERCEELERAYWKTLTYAAPLYGADMMGTLFDDRTESWNLNKLPNLLDVLGTKIPGVNTAYLYFGMWKATFAWHLEDVDLYSINYVHFGAPKQWYSISQADARRFENAMKNIWPADAKACSQFLRHKGFLISPQHLLNNYNIQVNKVVSYPGEFVVTFPYGYHSGYNLGYNCAEAVNFALEPWLEMGKIAKRCECAQAQDSVWINVYEIERKLRGEETEYEETDDDDEEDEEDDDETGLPSPPNGHGVKIKLSGKKRKRAPGDAGKPRAKKIKLRLRTKAEPPCCLCPNDVPALELLPTDDGRKVHRMCALYLPETYIDTEDGKEVVFNVNRIHKDRSELKCLYCRSKRGACFQCSQGKCARAYHATCAAAAGVFVEEEDVPVFGEDNVEYKEQAFEFSCRFHRSKRDKKLDGPALEEDGRVRSAAQLLKAGDICQLQYLKGDIFAGIVVENRSDEHTLLVDVLPGGDRLEVEWKFLLVPDPADYHLPKASTNAIPMPTSRSAKDKINGKRPDEERPRKDDAFTAGCTWAEFNYHELERNKEQVQVDFGKPDQLWHYIPGKPSTETKAQYTEDPEKQPRRANPKGIFLDTLPKAPKPYKPPVRKPAVSTQAQFQPYKFQSNQPSTTSFARFEKPYVYKPKQPLPAANFSTYTAQQFAPASQLQPQQQYQSHHMSNNGSYQQGQSQGQNSSYSNMAFELKPPQPAYPQEQWAYPTSPPPQSTQGYWSYPPQPPQQGYAQSPQPQQGYGQTPQYSQQHQSYGQAAPQQQGNGWSPPAQNQIYAQSYHAQPNYSHSPQSQQPHLQGQQPGQQPQVSLQAYSQGLRPQSTQSHCYSHTPLSQLAQNKGGAQSPSVPGSSASPAPTGSTVGADSPAAAPKRPVSAVSPASRPPQAPTVAGAHPRKPSTSRPSWTVTPKVYQDYDYFQFHFNRKSTDYRTPYSPEGGFANGYAGDVKAYLEAHPEELTRKMSGGIPPNPAKQDMARPNTTHSNYQLNQGAKAQQAKENVPPDSGAALSSQQSAPGSPAKAKSKKKAEPKELKFIAHAVPSPSASRGLQSAAESKPVQVETSTSGPLKPEPNAQPVSAPQAPAKAPLKQSPVPLPSKEPKQSPVPLPVKQSPVPLPPNFLAAMGPPKPVSPVATPPPPTAGKNKSGSKRKASNASTTPPDGADTPSYAGSLSSTPGKISTTPVPIPRLPGMTPHQAAQAMKQNTALQTVPTPAPQAPVKYSKEMPPPESPAQVNGAPNSRNASLEVSIPDATPQLAPGTQEFPDVPGSESMEFMERMMANLRRVSRN